jgi:sn-glycerol 3-phosphate transport system substrate-binding protein
MTIRGEHGKVSGYSTVMHRRALLVNGALAGAAALACGGEEQLRGRVVVPLWFTYGGKNRTTLEALVRRFNERQSDVFVRTIFQGDYFEGLAKLRTALAAGVAPPLSHVIGEVIPYLAHAGVLEPLDGYPGASRLPILPALGQAGSFRGGEQHPLYIVPFNRSTPIAYLNRPLFEAQKLGPPRTWEELKETAATLTARSGKTRFGFGCPIDWWFWAALVGQAGADVVEPDGAITLGGSAGVEALELWQALVQRGEMKPPPGRDYNAWEQLNQDFLAGRVAMIWTSTAFLRYIEDTADFPVLAAPLPAYRRAAVPTGGTHFIILKAAPAELKQAAYRFLQFMLEPEAAAFWSTETGYMPATTGAVVRLEASGYYEQHPNFRIAVDQLSVARPWPWSKNLFRVQREIVQPRLEGAVLAGGAPKAILAEARRLARASLE